jgi:poly(3-hydroxyalkanoate) synthetase
MASPPLNPFWEYWVDAVQRSAIFMDVLRQRGDEVQQHWKAGNPPVLVFPYETVIDGKTLERPVNYALLRIIPDESTPIDPCKRPIFIVDPRAGHGPGIGGSKLNSEIGVALRYGHPVYFVSFHPTPEPGQTIADISRAEAVFLKEVIRRHPDAPKPCVYGNCQAGWAVAMLAAVAPDLMGPIVLSGAPLSYWSGSGTQNAIRYLGGLWGGTWITAFMCDLGAGTFDGANLVANFENLNPANTLWAKPYNLYRNVDTEPPRFLDFELWWNGFFLMNAEEMQFIVDNLFIGNRLAANEVHLDGQPVRLKDIKEPIVVFASRGDNITPPQQALNWIVDVYGSDQAIVEDNQVIVYNLHEDVGHLGIFVGGKVAEKQHAAIIDSLAYTELLPPGLYELEIALATPGDGFDGDRLPEYSLRYVRRSLDDIRQLDDSRQDEAAFGTLARISEYNKSLYTSFVQPWLRLFVTEQAAEVTRELHPLRAKHVWLSSLNPWMTAIAVQANLARQWRQPVSPDNPYHRLEQQMAQSITTALNAYRDLRDSAAAFWFEAIYGPGGLGAILQPASSTPTTPYQSSAERKYGAAQNWLAENLDKGGFAAAVTRMIIVLALADQEIEPRTIVHAWHALREHSRMGDYTEAQIQAIGKVQFFMLYLDPTAAIAALPKLLPTTVERTEALGLARQIVLDGKAPNAEEQQAIAVLERELGLSEGVPS